jgi:hypothetical protein
MIVMMIKQKPRLLVSSPWSRNGALAAANFPYLTSREI